VSPEDLALLESEALELEAVLWHESATDRERERAEERLDAVRKQIATEEGT
jgi:hypothetical protein